MKKPLVVFVNGINDQRCVQVLSVDSELQASYLFNGSAAIGKNLQQNCFETQQLLLDFESEQVKFKRLPDLIFNDMADADSHSQALEKLSQLLKYLPVPVINHPDFVAQTRRDRLYALLNGIPGIVTPKTVRCAPHGPQNVLELIREHAFDYPVIVRECGRHNGERMALLTNPDDFSGLHALPFDGRAFYLIQYIDTQVQGVFTKYRVVVIDGQPRFNHLCYGQHWNVHYYSVWDYMMEHPAGREKELHLFEHFENDLGAQLEKPLQAMYQRLQLDYFGIDFALDAEQNMVIFEVNPTMRMLALTESEICRYNLDREQMNQSVVNMIQKRLATKGAQ